MNYSAFARLSAAHHWPPGTRWFRQPIIVDITLQRAASPPSGWVTRRLGATRPRGFVPDSRRASALARPPTVRID
jgi:hypothetical protein